MQLYLNDQSIQRQMPKPRTITRDVVFIWENFGPIHNDRCEAVAESTAQGFSVFGIELAGRSHTYPWRPASSASYKKITLFPDTTIKDVLLLRRIFKTLRACLSISRKAAFFFCHYEEVATFFVAAILRILGRDVFVMNDSKFDDYERRLLRELGKSIFYLPYKGALAAGRRSADYLRFLGFPREKIAPNHYNTVSIKRIRQLSRASPAPSGVPFGERHFTIIARFVPKKNLLMAIDAYALYVQKVKRPRPLHLCGGGPLEEALRHAVSDENLTEFILFRGFLKAEDVAITLSSTLALLLPSIEEQFGHVVIEAQAMGVPVILTENCGARDDLIRSAVNGFVVEPDNARGLAFFMSLLCEDEDLWRRMSLSVDERALNGDVANFANVVKTLICT
jgi:L-malate glycosyltransferase